VKTILHLVETGGPGGAEQMLVALVEHLDPTRYHSIICLPRVGWLQSELEKRGFETVVLRQHGVLDLAWLFRIVRLVTERRVNLIHAHEFAMNAYGTLVSVLTNTPLVATVHGKNYYAERWRRRLAYRWVAKRAVVVAVSNDLKHFLRNHVGLADNEVVTLHNGIDSKAFPESDRAGATVRRELGLGDRSVIGTIGNLYPVKGHRYFLEAAALVTKTIPNAAFVIAGRGDLLSDLQHTAQMLGIDRQVLFLGHRQDIAALLQAMDVFVLPSLSEGLPLALLEAMSARKPVVGTAVGGVPEVIVDGETGLIVPPKDAPALAHKIVFLLTHPDEAMRLGRLARLRVEEQFSVSSMVRGYEDLYARCVADRSSVDYRRAAASARPN